MNTAVQVNKGNAVNIYISFSFLENHIFNVRTDVQSYFENWFTYQTALDFDNKVASRNGSATYMETDSDFENFSRSKPLLVKIIFISFWILQLFKTTNNRARHKYTDTNIQTGLSCTCKSSTFRLQWFTVFFIIWLLYIVCNRNTEVHWTILNPVQ